MNFKYQVEKEYNGWRIIDILKAVFGISGLLAKKIRLYGNVNLNGQSRRMIDLAYTGDLIEASPAKNQSDVEPFIVQPTDAIPILFQDDHLLIINKPAGLVVHPTYTHPDHTLLDLLSERKLHPVTRLDRETSGVMILAKHGHAHYRIMQNPIKRIYHAINHGCWRPQAGEINAPIGLAPDTVMIRQVLESGKQALSYYQVLAESIVNQISLTEFTLVTGRTHQIRVHSLYEAHPILADGLYGIADYFPDSDKIIPDIQHSLSRIKTDKQKDFLELLTEKSRQMDNIMQRQALHARQIGFTHPITRKYMEFTADYPQDIQNLIQAYFKDDLSG